MGYMYLHQFQRRIQRIWIFSVNLNYTYCFRYYSEQYAGDVLDRVPSCFLVLGAIYICLQVIGCLMLSEPKEVFYT